MTVRLVTGASKMSHLKTNNKRVRERGTTLIELSVVIAVLLLLVGVLFIGINAWRAGANKAACIINLSSIQKAARGYANMNAIAPGAAETPATLLQAGFWTVAPTCPDPLGKYTLLAVAPAVGKAYATCSLSGTPTNHAPTALQLASW